MAITVRTQHIGSSRYYVARETGKTAVTVPGVTSVLDVIPKNYLRDWYAKMAAELAVDSVDFVARMSSSSRKGAVDYLKAAAPRHSGRRSDIGSAAHILFEQIIRGDARVSVAAAVKGTKYAHLADDSEALAETECIVDGFEDFLQDVQPELVSAEDIAWSDTYSYGGSFDAQLRIKVNPDTRELDPQGTPMTLMCDWKTGKAVYPDVSLQLAAYAHADRVISADGTSYPMPELNGAAVMHATELKWEFRSVRADDRVFAFFLTCLDFFAELRLWEGEGYGRNRIPGLKDEVLGKALAKSSRRVTGTERRA
ncbi:hypothetical protein LHJ74_30760 [Streptomyces sp. N2-109]|uniref:PD-(D/E)XK endonuclease-like domain-containing protein n=1 Tax=Streptomyces gossypii TaxID=2883101 RepID=A0ABT2K242_9ACTN|nr:hypothetical protein [Streptomyces gossypii]MCT2594238.1 hypothetical protein [Streptomyces gossypii]